MDNTDKSDSNSQKEAPLDLTAHLRSLPARSKEDGERQERILKSTELLAQEIKREEISELHALEVKLSKTPHDELTLHFLQISRGTAAAKSVVVY